MKRSRWIALATVALAVVLATAGTAAGASKTHNNGGYTVTPLVSDQAGMAPMVDPNLVNGWGISAGPVGNRTPWWVANQGTDTTTLYNGRAALPASRRRTGPGRAHRNRLLRREPGSRFRQAATTVGAREVPLRHALRHDSGLASGRGNDASASTARPVGRGLHRPRDLR